MPLHGKNLCAPRRKSITLFPVLLPLDSLTAQAYIRDMNKLSIAKRTAVVAALVEGNSVRATARMTGVSKPTILKLLADLGAACTRYQDETIRNVRARRIQCDEIWQYVLREGEERPRREAGRVRLRGRVAHLLRFAACPARR